MDTDHVATRPATGGGAWLLSVLAITAAGYLGGAIGVLLVAGLMYWLLRWPRAHFISALVLIPVLFVAGVIVRDANRNFAEQKSERLSQAVNHYGPTAPRPVATAADKHDETIPARPNTESWNQAALVFEADHQELKLGNNYKVMQEALDSLPPTLSDSELLRRAYETAKKSPHWTSIGLAHEGKVLPNPPDGFTYDANSSGQRN